MDNTPGDSRTISFFRVGDVVDNELETPNDQDWFRVELQAGMRYAFAMNARFGDPDFDSFLRILDSNSRELAVNDDGSTGLNSLLEFTAPYSGLFFVSAESYLGESTGPYQIISTQLSSNDPSDISGEIPTNTSVALGTVFDSRIDVATDLDIVRTELVEGRTYQFTAESRDLVFAAGPPLNYPYLLLAGADEIVVEESFNTSGPTANIAWTAEFTGTHYLGIFSFNGSLGGYRFSMRGVDEAGDSLANARLLQGVDAVNEGIDFAGDVDVYQARLVAGVTYNLDLSANVSDGFNGQLEIRPPAGAAVTRSGNGQLVFTATATGVHALTVSGVAGVQGEYRLVVTNPVGSVLDSFDALNYLAVNTDVLRATGAVPDRAIEHYANFGFSEGRALGGFDALLYNASNLDLARLFGTDARAGLEHYVNLGFAEGRAASGFSPELYAAANPDLARLFGTNRESALQHWLAFGADEGRATSGFDARLYVASNADLARSIGADTAAAVQHYLASGARDGRPTAGFDPLAYAAAHSDLARVFGTDGQAAFNHYLALGADEGRKPSGFDALAYGAANADLAQVFGTDAQALRLHWLTFGADEARGTSGFDPLLYAASNPDLARIFGLDRTAALNHWLTFGADEGRATNSFDPLLYAASSPDLARKFGPDPAAALGHWLTFGADEGRATASFDPLIYAATYTDLARAFGTNETAALNHWLSVGADEGRTSAGFDPALYLAANSDLQAAGFTPAQALVHWLTFGVYEDRQTAPVLAMSYVEDAALNPAAAFFG